MFPTVSFFKNQLVISEIKETVVNLFKDHPEHGLADMYGTPSDSKDEKPAERKVVTDEKATGSFMGMGFAKSSSNRSSGLLSSAGSNLSDLSTDEDSQSSGMNTPRGMSIHQRHVSESLEEKKRRLFKWNDYERVMLNLNSVKA